MKKHLATIILLLSLALGAGGLLLFEHNLLWKAQETNMFLFSTLFLKQQMVVAGGFLSWLATWFTQFFFYPWVGVLLLCLWWMLLMWLTKRAFRIPSQWAVVLLIPVALLLTTITDLGYWIYLLKLPGHIFVATIGTCIVVALLWAFRCIPNRYGLRAVFMVAVCAVGYPLFGVYGLAATLLMGIWSWRLKGSDGQARVTSRRMEGWGVLLNSVVAILSVVTIPLLFYRYVYYETSFSNIYRVELPLYIVDKNYPLYYIPFCLLGLFYLALTLFKLNGKTETLVSTNKGGGREKKTVKKKTWKDRHVGTLLLQTVLFAAIVFGVYHFWFKDENFHHELAMQHSIDQLDWQGVLDEATTQKCEPTRAVVMMRNLVLARLGRQGNEMYHYRNGSKQINAPFPMRMVIVAGPLVYYHYGMVNYCVRLSMEMSVEYGWRIEYNKNLARCAVLTGEHQLARKYLGILKQTMFYDKWAENVESLIGHDEAIRKHPEMGFITHMMHYDRNKLTADQGYVEQFLMKQLSNSTNTDDPVFQEQTLLASMWTRDEEMFWKHLSDYIKLHPKKDLPIHYQEAALLFGSLEERPDIDKWPLATSVRDSYNRFCETAPQYDEMEVEAVRTALYPFFGDTYYYEYYLMENLPQY